MNLLELSKIDHDEIWEIVEETRKFCVSENEPQCYYSNLLSNYDIKYNVLSVLQKVGFNKTLPKQYENVSVETLHTAGKMFTYLNTCPPLKVHDFYRDLFETATTREIILVMINIMKTSQNYEKKSAYYIFKKFMGIMNLTQYENIQILTKGRCLDGSIFGNCRKTTDMKKEGKTKEIGFKNIFFFL